VTNSRESALRQYPASIVRFSVISTATRQSETDQWPGDDVREVAIARGLLVEAPS
jgi:hypothetical protein